MNKKALISISLAAGMLLGAGAAPAIGRIAARQGLTASAAAQSGTTVDGWKFSSDGTSCTITGAENTVQGEVAIPASIQMEDGTSLPVTKISGGFRSNAKYITGLTIPASVNLIDNFAFKGLNNLTSVKFEGKILVLNEDTFADCTSLESVTLPEGLMEIGTSCFAGCTRLNNIKLPSTLSTIGSKAFASCESLTSITIPAKVTEITGEAFKRCKALKNVTIENGVKTIGFASFGACDSIEEITIPKSVNTISNMNSYCMFSDWGNYAANIKSVTIENPDCEFWQFQGTEEKPLTIYGYEGSTAQKYCEENGERKHVVFKSIGEKPAPQPVNDYGEFCDANGDGDIDSADAQFVLLYYVEKMAGNEPSWYALTKNPKAPDAP